jgi:hypothetical protein
VQLVETIGIGSREITVQDTEHVRLSPRGMRARKPGNHVHLSPTAMARRVIINEGGHDLSWI